MGRVRTAAKWAGVVAGSLGGLVAAWVAWVGLAPLPTYDVAAPDLTVEVTAARVERGKKIASLLCSGCHYDAATGALSGREAPYPRMLGEFWSRNLTPGPTDGIGTWSDGQLFAYLRTGVGPDGRQRFMGPEVHLADEDVLSVIAFLRSDDPWVRPVDNHLPPSKPSLMGKMVARQVLKAPPEFPGPPVPLPDPADPVALGRYVVVAEAGCWACHSGTSFNSIDLAHPEQTPDYLAGRMDEGPDGKPIWTQNLTFDDETGLGQWSYEDFRRVVTRGFKRDGTVVRPPMTLFADVSETEVAAVWAYLQTVPEIRKPRETPPNEVLAVADLSPGAAAYDRYGCPACHGDDGHLSCDLRGAHAKYADDAALEAFIRHPEAFVSPVKMPAWDGVVADADWAPLVAHVRELGRQASADSASPP